MRTESTIPLVPPAIRNGVLILSGYGIRASVERKHLVVSDGIGRERRRMRLSKATSGLTRLVILGHMGIVSLEALRWLRDIGAGFAQIDADGQVVAAWGPARHPDAQLLRRQALAASNGVGLELARDLIVEKLRGQGAVLQKFPDLRSAIGAIDQGIRDLKRAKSFDQIRIIEAVAGAPYWNAWKTVRVGFAHKDRGRVPDHWLLFGARASPLTGSPRNAANPANALLNYLYGILESEARIAALAVGLDPSMGILHADQRFRNSLACDLMEPVRPVVDAFVLDMLYTRTFSVGDFFETRQGVCRVLTPITHLVAGLAPMWAKAVAPVAEQVARALWNDRQKNSRAPQSSPPTPLTQANRSAGRKGMRRHPKSLADRIHTIPKACHNCGVILKNSDRLYCEECLPERRREVAESSLVAGREVLAQLRTGDRDPAHGGTAARKRGKRIGQCNRDAATWNHENIDRPYKIDFTRDILPRLENSSLQEMAQVTGLSIGYCSFVRRGLRVPHPRHWESLGRIKRISDAPFQTFLKK